jgi:hypothetical protein
MVRPAVLLVIPGPAAIIIAPVLVDREGHDRQADHPAIGHQRDIAALIRGTEARCIHPAAQIRAGDIAPLKVADTAHHRDRHAAWQLLHDRVVGRGACPHIDDAVGERLRLRVRRSGQREQTGCYVKTSNEVLLHSFSRFNGRIQADGLRAC